MACGWMVEAIGEEDDQIASIAFDLHRLDIPEFATATPRILGYNSIGELVSEDVKGFTLTCSESVGTAEGDVFRATDVDAWGTITATLDGMSATIPVHVMPATPRYCSTRSLSMIGNMRLKWLRQWVIRYISMTLLAWTGRLMTVQWLQSTMACCRE